MTEPSAPPVDDVAPAPKVSRWSTLTLSRRLVVGIVVVTAVTLVVVAGATFVALRAWMIDQVDAGLMQPKAQLYQQTGDRGRVLDALQGWTAAGVRIVVLDSSGNARSLPLPGFQGSTSTEWSAQDAATLKTVPTAPTAQPVTVQLDAVGTARAVAVPALDESQNAVTIVAVSPLSRVTEVAGRFVVVELIAILAAILIVAIVGTWFVRRSLRPLREVADTAGEVVQLQLGRGDVAIPTRVPNEPPSTEVGQVALAVNAMLDHVETSLRTRAETEDRLRRFVSDAGHELRTPLASVRGYAELMRRGAAADPAAAAQAAARIEAAASRMGLLVEDLLLLASLDEERPLARERLDLATLVDEAVAEVAATGPDRHWSAATPTDGDPVVVIGDPTRLHQAITNLLVNARAHTPAGTSVTAAAGRDDDVAWVEVRDDGPGFSEDLLPRATERFTRGDYSRSRATGGSGLGLAIVKAVVEAHGGTLTVGNAADGPGAVVRVELPVAVVRDEETLVDGDPETPEAVEALTPTDDTTAAPA